MHQLDKNINRTLDKMEKEYGLTIVEADWNKDPCTICFQFDNWKKVEVEYEDSVCVKVNVS